MTNIVGFVIYLDTIILSIRMHFSYDWLGHVYFTNKV